MQIEYKYKEMMYRGTDEFFSITEAGRTWSVEFSKSGDWELCYSCTVCIPKQPEVSRSCSRSYAVSDFFDFVHDKVLFLCLEKVRSQISEIEFHIEYYFQRDVIEEINKLYQFLKDYNDEELEEEDEEDI